MSARGPYFHEPLKEYFKERESIDVPYFCSSLVILIDSGIVDRSTLISSVAFGTQFLRFAFGAGTA